MSENTYLRVQVQSLKRQLKHRDDEIARLRAEVERVKGLAAEARQLATEAWSSHGEGGA